ncbi:hypothetical protein RDWZM_006492 [Blomia tropicalis]|uniref:RING-CH-type domain-containing protein n=1 Tax=Blomia tropicalis TaxID=40697 RepID=A0A9Q0M7U8_BLOTA|nr:hypothetical protein RDWZM_006492 [Blomia tropicalis]
MNSQSHLVSSLFAAAAAAEHSTNVGRMFLTDNTCKSNCSGHGDCFNGTCFCEVEYSGGTCNDPNFKYYVSFSTVYYMICVVSFIQLMLCINSEIARQKPRNILRAFQISTQKALYFFICLGTAIRGFYFSSPANSHIGWAESLMSAYYPIVMSGCGLVVCFWAEVFHLNVSVERSRFLSKSFNGFIIFNVVTYSLLLAELVLFVFADPSDSDRGLFLQVFHSIYAIFMLIVVIFFLIYGVEVYFKVRGAFIQNGISLNLDDGSYADMSQLQQSRLGLISQAVLLLITIIFMFSDVFGWLWKDKVPVLSRNYHQVMFRVVEFGVALWFPCVLMEGKNGGSIFQVDEHHGKNGKSKMLNCTGKTIAESELLVDGLANNNNNKTIVKEPSPECWICYESYETKPELGILIQPCSCRGDVSAVHHQCLIRWLMEAYESPNAYVQCKVCNTPYRVEHSSEFICLPSGLSVTHWLKTATIVLIMGISLTGSCMIVKMFSHMYVKTISVGSCILVEYICLRLLGFNLIAAYHRAKFSAIKIIGRKITSQSSSNHHHHHQQQQQQQQQQHAQQPDLYSPQPSTSGLNLKSNKHLTKFQQVKHAKAEVHCQTKLTDQDYNDSMIPNGKIDLLTLRSLSASVDDDDHLCSSILCENSELEWEGDCPKTTSS